jgi:transcriptional regulator with XRE-family HTH domain
MEAQNKVIGRNLCNIRKIGGLTQKQLGEKSTTVATVGNYERRDRYIPR